MKYGYARISTTDQNAALQQDALTSAGCDKIITIHFARWNNENQPLEVIARETYWKRIILTRGEQGFNRN